ncbi:MAG TPA: 2'-deoxycytidine 5'-triphosphate deaminase, partial [Terriglobales bacterium]|nr:2'-deoxycytidine 5'-triphosphate deaminase [Terriglobales bacterium]
MPCDLGAPGPALFPELEENEVAASRTGVLPSQDIRDLIAAKRVFAGQEISEDQIQPASLDLRLGDVAHRVRASFLPGRERTVAEGLRSLTLHTLDLRDGAVLERNCIYIVPLLEHLALRYRTSGSANPKSSTGRLNVFARVITDYGTE